MLHKSFHTGPEKFMKLFNFEKLRIGKDNFDQIHINYTTKNYLEFL